MSGWVQRLGRGVRAAAPYAFTLAVIAACCVVFVAEFVRDGLGLLNFLDEISLDTLYAMGGLLVMPGQAVGEWSRLVTATFLHADIAHLARNVAVIAGAGIALERMAGKGGFLIAVAVSLFAGNAAAYAAHSGGGATIIVGASGLAYGLVGAGLMSCALNRDHAEPLGDVRYFLYIAALCSLGSLFLVGDGSILAWLAGASDETAISAHVGGLVAGAATMVVLPFRGTTAPLPARIAAALAIAAAFAAFLIIWG